jgi:ferredoxin
MAVDIKITVIDRDGESHVLDLPTDMGLNLMESCKSYDLPVDGTCGGMAMCASCQCYVKSDHISLDRSDAEQAMLDEAQNVKENSRLGCQIPVTEALDGLVIELAPNPAGEDDSLDDW